MFTKFDKRKLTILIGALTASLILIGALSFLIAMLTAPKAPAAIPTDTLASTGTTAQISTSGTVPQTQATPDVPTTQPLPTQPESVTQQDPQIIPDGGASTDISDAVQQTQPQRITLGIDVSKYQGTIDWAQVAGAGVDFAMVRVGYRTQVSGEIIADPNAKYNMQEATKHGIKIGAYFFSTATTREEAVQEANWVADYIARYSITYPVAYNCEGFSDPDNRQYSLSKTQRTDLALAFLQTIAQRGYTPMFYAAKNELQADAQWETSRIEPNYQVWVAQYPAQPYPQVTASAYTGKHTMWQYTASGTVPGIAGRVDLNVAYFGYDENQTPQDTQPPEQAKPDIEALMTFSPVNETVTAKIETNLRDIPSQGSDSTVCYTLKNGETATRIGISNSGWSKVLWNGNTYYAVSSYLTTDLSSQEPEPTQPQETIKTPFTSMNDPVTAKDVVNLRTLPSVTDPNSQVVAQLTHGEVVTRTGINHDVGWSRVDYNGQTLYCVSSYLMTPEEPTPETT